MAQCAAFDWDMNERKNSKIVHNPVFLAARHRRRANTIMLSSKKKRTFHGHICDVPLISRRRGQPRNWLTPEAKVSFFVKTALLWFTGGPKSPSHYSSLMWAWGLREELKGQTQTKLHDLIICIWGFKKIQQHWNIISSFLSLGLVKDLSKQHIPNPIIKVWMAIEK